jgi:chemotaxis methyl-accepting protein methylase
MHAIMLQVLYDTLKSKLSHQHTLRLLDLGCGYGYSTLAFAILIDELMNSSVSKVEIVGADIH